jgi:hypothetical protein
MAIGISEVLAVLFGALQAISLSRVIMMEMAQQMLRCGVNRTEDGISRVLVVLFGGNSTTFLYPATTMETP